MTEERLEAQPRADAFPMDDVMRYAWKGIIRVPHFQRGFRWSSKDVIRLFDSILRGYPIGSLLLWVRNADAETLTLGALSIEAPANDQAWWVVDGQQRIISLANALHSDGAGDDRFNLYYDLDTKNFTTPSARNRSSESLIPLPVLWDLEKLLGWFAKRGVQHNPERLAEATRVAKRLREYRIPAYLVEHGDQATLTDIFDRMNNYGKRLSRSEIFEALTASPEAEADKQLTLSKIAERINATTQFGIIPERAILAAFLARRGTDPMRDVRSEFDQRSDQGSGDFPEETDEEARENCAVALEQAVHFLQHSAGVPHISMLSYESLLVVLTRFFAHFPDPSSNSLLLLRRWYWRTAIAGPTIFKGSFTQMNRALPRRIVPGKETESVQGLLAAIAGKHEIPPTPEMLRTNTASSKHILCSWWELRPRSFETGEPFTIADIEAAIDRNSTARDAVQQLYIPRRGGRSSSPANYLLLPSVSEPVDDLVSVLSSPIVDQQATASTFHSHLLDEAAVNMLRGDDFHGFLEHRGAAIDRQLRRFLIRMTEWDLEDTPDIALFELDGDS
ncbi:DUF262 domain-containing protein [Glycomyces rhizosphaerae]|uniref:DUF262 domain-containing protein n=1 Tax=Glycomyces rhizosphaerae TaxID=2054422 RepID=A0ABV7Q0N0_9ACTN